LDSPYHAVSSHSREPCVVLGPCLHEPISEPVDEAIGFGLTVLERIQLGVVATELDP
jgi:hypothetical protein